MGYLCFLTWAFFSGALGGLIFAFTSSEDHLLRIPFTKKSSEMGVFGNMIIGSAAGLLALSICISHFSFDIKNILADDARPFLSATPLGRQGAIVLLHTFAISLVGGFLGLKLIVRIADEALSKLADKIRKDLKKDIDEGEENAAIYRHALFARSLRADGFLTDAEVEIARSLEIRPTKFGEFVNALILRSRGKYQDAINALDRALKLPVDGFVKTDANLYWNKACYIGLLDPMRIREVIELLDKSINLDSRNKEDIRSDVDLKQFLDKEPFRAHYGKLIEQTHQQ